MQCLFGRKFHHRVLCWNPAGWFLFQRALITYALSDECAFPKACRKLSKVTVMQTPGANFGLLVREKRGIEQLSQDALVAITGLTKARISDLENGKIANPHAKTIDALCVALNITRAERRACHTGSPLDMPSRVLETLALRFGMDNPDALEADFEAFLREKATEFRDMKGRLAAISESNQAIRSLIDEAQSALGRGHMDLADNLLERAEAVQLAQRTLPMVEQQSNLSLERGKAALFTGDVERAARHFERSARYYAAFDVTLEMAARWKYVGTLREYAYRYRNAQALFEARDALVHNLGVWTETTHPNEWAKSKNALGAVFTRLAQFDRPELQSGHYWEGRRHFEDLRANADPRLMAEFRAFAEVNLATVLQERSTASSDAGHIENVLEALRLQVSAFSALTREKEAVQWGILQHNLACSFIKMASLQGDSSAAAADLEAAIEHANLSFEVRDGPDELQYWIASARTKSEALITLSNLAAEGAGGHRSEAADLLDLALAKISEADHPHQWSELQCQLSRLSPDRKP